MYLKVIKKIFFEVEKNNLKTKRTQNVPGKTNNCERIIEIISKLLKFEAKRKFFRYLEDKK